jgi:acetyl-CoA carboxylase biotin carboxyl carrier protein
MNQKEIKDLIEFLIEKEIAEFELERGDVKLRIKRTSDAPAVTHFVHSPQGVAAAMPPIAHVPPTQAMSAPTAGEAPAAKAETAAPATDDAELFTVKSPIVGTYYEAPSPGSPPFSKVGDEVKVGQVLCIIEAMKLMNEIESEAAGTVHKILVKNGQPVEYGQPLFLIKQHK